jgi:hypothetical protein
MDKMIEMTGGIQKTDELRFLLDVKEDARLTKAIVR